MERPAQRTGALKGRQRRRAGLEDLVAARSDIPARRPLIRLPTRP